MQQTIRITLGAVALALAADAAAVGPPVESSPVDVINAEDLDLPGKSIGDLLQAQVPGIVLVPRGGAGDAGLRNTTGTLVLINGVRLSNDALGAIPDSAIERVEVMKDGASALFGSSATNGAINIITKRDRNIGAVNPAQGQRGDLGYVLNGYMNDINVGAEWTAGCDVTAGLARPFWTYGGGLPLGGPLWRDNTWFVKPPAQGFDFSRRDWTTFGSGPATRGYVPFVYLDPAPADTLKNAVGPQAATAAGASAFPAELFRGGIPPETTVMRSDACPEEIKKQLAVLYQQRTQAQADMVYYNDFRSDFPPDPARAAEARARRDQANEEIRKLLDQCQTPTATSAAAAPATTGQMPGMATAPGADKMPAPKLSFRLTEGFGVGDYKPARDAGLDIGLRADYALPGEGPKDVNTWSDWDPMRGFTDLTGKIEFQMTPEVADRLGVDPKAYDVLKNWGRYTQPLPQFELDYPNTYRPYQVTGDYRNGYVINTPLWLNRIDSTIVELGGTRPNVALGSGDGLVPDPRDRFRPALDQTDGKFPTEIRPYFADAFNIGTKTYFVFNYPQSLGIKDSDFNGIRGDTAHYNNDCADEALPVTTNDPAYQVAGGSGRKGSWGQAYDDQWAIKRVGLTNGADSAWGLLPDTASPVVVGVIDTGLDWHHQDFGWDNLWRNPKEVPGNGLDDDNNGYVDDVIGWDFTNHSNKPWDNDGHGTFVAGIIAATRDNSAGVAGINPKAKIMVLKALNTFGRTRASHLAKAIAYGADNGARILNLSVAGKGTPPVVQEAIRYAESKGVLVIVAAGNTGENIGGIHPAGAAGAMVVAATDPADRRTNFSNWGAGISIAAPGVDVMSLRARRTDFMWNSADTAEYRPGANILGTDRRYYRSTGTSFAAPIITGVASLLWSKTPSLTAADVRRIIEQSARDIETPGHDQFTGFGLVDARAALAADAKFFIESLISGVAPVPRGRDVLLEVSGTADADRFKRAWLEYGAGENPASFKRVSPDLKAAVTGGKLGEISARELGGTGSWTLRLMVEHENGSVREARFKLDLN